MQVSISTIRIKTSFEYYLEICMRTIDVALLANLNDCAFQYILLKMTINIPLKWEISVRIVFPDLGLILTTGLKCWLTVKFFQSFFSLKLLYKKCKLVKHKVISSLFWNQRLLKDRGAQICTPAIWIELGESDIE